MDPRLSPRTLPDFTSFAGCAFLKKSACFLQLACYELTHSNCFVGTELALTQEGLFFFLCSFLSTNFRICNKEIKSWCVVYFCCSSGSCYFIVTFVLKTWGNNERYCSY